MSQTRKLPIGTINIGAINLKISEYEKFKSAIGGRDRDGCNLIIKEVLKNGEYKGKTLWNKAKVYAFEKDNLSILMNGSMRKVIHVSKLKQKNTPVPNDEEFDFFQEETKEIPFNEQGSNSVFMESVDSIISKIIEMETYETKLYEKLSEVDKEISKIYHEIEVKRFNAAEGYWYTKKLQEKLRIRRLVKTEIATVTRNLSYLKEVRNSLLQIKSKEAEQMGKWEYWTEGWNMSLSDIL